MNHIFTFLTEPFSLLGTLVSSSSSDFLLFTKTQYNNKCVIKVMICRWPNTLARVSIFQGRTACSGTLALQVRIWFEILLYIFLMNFCKTINPHWKCSGTLALQVPIAFKILLYKFLMRLKILTGTMQWHTGTTGSNSFRNPSVHIFDELL